MYKMVQHKVAIMDENLSFDRTELDQKRKQQQEHWEPRIMTHERRDNGGTFS